MVTRRLRNTSGSEGMDPLARPASHARSASDCAGRRSFALLPPVISFGLRVDGVSLSQVFVMNRTVGRGIHSYTSLLVTAVCRPAVIDRRKIMSARKFVLIVAVLVDSAVLAIAEA